MSNIRGLKRLILLCAAVASTAGCSDSDEQSRAAAAGSAGADATAGNAGADRGGAGGDDENSAGSSGAATAGGLDASPLNVEQACAKICADQAALSCAFASNCEHDCVATSTPEYTEFPDEYLAMVRCEAEQLEASNYYCSQMDGPTIWPAAQPGTACEAAICKWTCADGTYGDWNAFMRCCN